MIPARNYVCPEGTVFVSANPQNKVVHLFNTERQVLLTICNVTAISTVVNLKKPVCRHCMKLVKGIGI